MSINKASSGRTLRIRIESLSAKASVIVLAGALWVVLALAMLNNFISGALADRRAEIGGGLIASGIEYVPDSARLHARFAEVGLTAEDRDLASLESHATRAISLSPRDYKHRLLLAAIEEAKGDRAAAEKSLRDALKLAPTYTDVHWRLANLLFRQAKIAQSLSEFRISTSADSSLLPGTLDLIWRASGGNPKAIESVTPNDPKARLVLAQFLIKQARAAEAADVVASIDRSLRLSSPELSTALNSLINRGYIEQARELWIKLISDDKDYSPSALMWNGGFESDVQTDFDQFDWSLNRSEYARFVIDKKTARTGTNSLRVDFLGRDTTRLDGEARQLVVVRPGASYRLECYAKVDGLVITEAPRVVVTNAAQSGEIGSSNPIAANAGDWQRLAFDFVAPQDARAVYVTLKRIPKFIYDDPARGVIWLDDFSLTELRGSK